MVSRVKFRKRFKMWDLKKYTDIYAVESEVQRGVVYGISDGKFAIIDGWGAKFCPFHETPIMAMSEPKKVREEIIEVYEEVRELKQMGFMIS